MPKCRNCGARLSKFDKDICPVCGTENPLDGVLSETQEVTGLQSQFEEMKSAMPRKRKVGFILFLLFGVFGAGFFYFKKKKAGVIDLILSLLAIGGLGALFKFVIPLPICGFMYPIVAAYLINIAIGFYYLLTHDLKDGEGVFIQ